MNINLTRTRSALACLAALLLLCAPRAALAIGEQNGRIAGVVTEAQTTAPIPGATVRVSGKALIGGTRTVTTAEDGRYEVVELPPGTYDVEVSYEQTKPVRRRVLVRQGETVPLNIPWSVELANTEVVTIIEERHMT